MILPSQHGAAAHALDAGAVAIIASALMQWLPPIAAVLGVLWYLMQMIRFGLDWRRDFLRRRAKVKEGRRRYTD